MSEYTKEISNGEYGNGTKWRIQKVGSIYYYDIDACIIGFGDYVTGWQNVARSMDLSQVLEYRNRDLERLGDINDSISDFSILANRFDKG